VTEIREKEPLLVLVDEVMRITRNPALVPDLRAFFWQIADVLYSPTLIFHTLRDMVGEGLVAHTPQGYELTEEGEDAARRYRELQPEIAQRAAEVVRDYAVQ
jgi:hypothetical protein